jgi:hypothetical protein
VRYWFDRETRVWWAARYDACGNQIGDAVHAATRDGIRREIEACLKPSSPDAVYEYFLKHGLVCENGERRTSSMGTASNAFVVAYETGKIHVAVQKGSAAHAAARAGLKLRKNHEKQAKNNRVS